MSEDQSNISEADAPEARTLSEVNAAGPWRDQWAAVDAALSLLDQLHPAHVLARGHGAVHPAQISVDASGAVDLSFDGAGRAADPRYLPPEIGVTDRPQPAHDVFAVGAILFELLTGHAPTARPGAANAHSVLRVRSDLDPRLAAVVGRAVSPNPSERFGSAAELRAALSALRVPVSAGTELRRVTITPAGAARPPLPVRRSGWPALIGLLGLALAGLLAFLWLRGDSGGDGPRLQVPAVQGLPAADAQARLTQLGLKATLLQEPSVAVAVGNVIRSSPSAGTAVEAGSNVILVVSGQAVAGQVPSLVGLGQQEATSILSQFGLQATVTQQASDAPAGNVIAQSPDPGNQAQPGSAVTLTVSTGPSATTTTTSSTPTTTTGGGVGTMVQVPTVTGQTLQSATDMLIQAGLQLGAITREPSAQAEEIVLAQNPPAGASVTSGSQVSLQVSQGDAIP